MKEYNKLNPQYMFRHACAFADCARACEIEPSTIRYRTASHAVAGMVNSALACEVFIKSMLVWHGFSQTDFDDKHGLVSLWGMYKNQDEETAKSIEQRIKETFLSKNERMFTKGLENISNTFVKLRYVYEKEKMEIDTNFLRCFREELRRTCCEIVYKQTWEDFVKDSNNNYIIH